MMRKNAQTVPLPHFLEQGRGFPKWFSKTGKNSEPKKYIWKLNDDRHQFNSYGNEPSKSFRRNLFRKVSFVIFVLFTTSNPQPNEEKIVHFRMKKKTYLITRWLLNGNKSSKIQAGNFIHTLCVCGCFWHHNSSENKGQCRRFRWDFVQICVATFHSILLISCHITSPVAIEWFNVTPANFLMIKTIKAHQIERASGRAVSGAVVQPFQVFHLKCCVLCSLRVGGAPSEIDLPTSTRDILLIWRYGRAAFVNLCANLYLRMKMAVTLYNRIRPN